MSAKEFKFYVKLTVSVTTENGETDPYSELIAGFNSLSAAVIYAQYVADNDDSIVHSVVDADGNLVFNC